MKDNNELFQRLALKGNIDDLVKKIDLETDFNKILVLYYWIFEADKKLAEKITSKINIDLWAEKINLDLNIANFSLLLYYLQKTNIDKSEKLLSNINIDNLARKIDIESDFENIGICFFEISKINPNYIIEIINNKIFLENLYTKLNNAESSIGIVGFLTGMGITDKAMFKEIINRFSEKSIKAIQESKNSSDLDIYTEVMKDFQELLWDTDITFAKRIFNE